MSYLLKGIDPATGKEVVVNSSSLSPAQVYDIFVQFVGTPPAGGTLFVNVPIARALTLPINFAGSQAIAAVAPTANVYLTIQKNNTSIGNLNFTAGSTIGTFLVTSAVTFAPGDVLTIMNPNTTDSTFATLGVTFVATLD